MLICSIEGCNRQRQGKGYCRLHYGRFVRWGDPLVKPDKKKTIRLCSIEGCEEIHCGKGYCKKHYARYRVNGYPDKITYMHDLEL
jgi:hypothetical protein